MKVFNKRKWNEKEIEFSKLIEYKFKSILQLIDSNIKFEEKNSKMSTIIDLYNDGDFIERNIQTAMLYINKMITDYGIIEDKKE